MKRATLESSVAASISTDFKNNRNEKWLEVRHLEARRAMLLKGRNTLFNQKTDIIGLQIGSFEFQGPSFRKPWSRVG